jgi:DNA-binding transcriptional LysR family regulator
MHLKNLKVFCDVAHRRSFSRAAEDNGISQPTASSMVHQLEEHLGVTLFDRSKRPMVLTSEGDVYYRGCRRVVQKLAALEEEVRTFHQEVAGKVRVVSIYSIGLSHLDLLAKEFLLRYPRADVKLEYQHPDRVVELVKNEQFDFGLVSYPKNTRLIKAYSWRTEQMVLACSTDHPFASAKSIRIKQLAGLPLVSFAEGLRIRRHIDKCLAEHHCQMPIAMEFDNIETLKRAVEINAGVSLLPEPTIAREVQLGTLAAIPLQDIELTRPIGIVCRRGKQFGKTARHFLRLLRKHTESPTPVFPSASNTNFASQEEPEPANSTAETGSFIHKE